MLIEHGVTESHSVFSAKRRGDLNAYTVILSNAKDLFSNNQILRRRGSERQKYWLDTKINLVE